MTVLSLDMAYRLYGTISVNAIFLDFLILWSSLICASALIVRHIDECCNRAGIGSKRSEGSSLFSADHRATYLYSVGPMGPEP